MILVYIRLYRRTQTYCQLQFFKSQTRCNSCHLTSSSFTCGVFKHTLCISSNWVVLCELQNSTNVQVVHFLYLKEDCKNFFNKQMIEKKFKAVCTNLILSKIFFVSYNGSGFTLNNIITQIHLTFDCIRTSLNVVKTTNSAKKFTFFYYGFILSLSLPRRCNMHKKFYTSFPLGCTIEIVSLCAYYSP